MSQRRRWRGVWVLMLAVASGYATFRLATAGRAEAQDGSPGQGVAAPASHRPARPTIGAGGVVIRDIPHVRQRPDFCGEACVAMWLGQLGSRLDQDAVFDASGLNPLLGRGCYTGELITAAKKLGFAVGRGWYSLDARRADAQLAGLFENLLADLRRGVPSVVCMHYDDRPGTTEHFRLVVGYDPSKKEVLYHEPAEDKGAYRRMARATFLKLWPLKYRTDRWTVVRLALQPVRVNRKAAPADGLTDADYAQAVRTLRPKRPKGFTLVLEKPFLVVGDEPAATVRARAAGTVRWAVKLFRKDYFAKDPRHVNTIWLFRDKDSYEAHAKKLWGSVPGTPYGYYSPAKRALVMNIATGGGTLVHEMTHVFMDTNFPACPAWFNEGLASLYEQCGESDGKIVGYTNWRLAGLQRAIRAGKVPSFKTTCSTTTRAFYQSDPGTNYAQCRYLCYYLQQRGLLRKYYSEFVKNARTDPSGYATLKDVLGCRSDQEMATFQATWEKWVLRLRFP